MNDLQNIKDWLANAPSKEITTLAKLSFDRSWGEFVGRSVSVDQARLWLEQFDDADAWSAFMCLLNLTYYDSEDYRYLCRLGLVLLATSHRVDVGRAVFVPVGPLAKSGHLAAYYFRTSTVGARLRFPDSLEWEPSSDDIIVFVDDYVGTGDQFTKWWQTSAYAHHPQELQYYLALVGTHRAELTVQSTGITPAFVQMRKDFLDFNRADAEIFEKYGAGLFEHKGEDLPLGWGGCCSGVVFFYNTPNNVPPIFWAEQTNKRGQSWKPLLRRHDESSISVSRGLGFLIDKTRTGDALSDEEILHTLELLAELRRTGASENLATSEIVALCTTLSEFYASLDAFVRAPAIAAVVLQTRLDLIRVLSNRARRTGPPSVAVLCELLGLERFTQSQKASVWFDIRTEIIDIVRPLSALAKERCLADLLRAAMSSNAFEAEGAFWTLYVLEKEGHVPPIPLETIRRLTPGGDQAAFQRLLLLCQRDPSCVAEAERVLIAPMIEKVGFTQDHYGKPTFLSVRTLLDGRNLAEYLTTPAYNPPLLELTSTGARFFPRKANS